MKEYDILELKNSWNSYYLYFISLLSEAKKIANKIITEKYIKDYREFKLKNQDKKLKFNIFELVSDKYYLENFHSDIIAQLLKNRIFLSNFLDYIHLSDVSKKLYIENESLQILREKSRVDILIKTKKAT